MKLGTNLLRTGLALLVFTSGYSSATDFRRISSDQSRDLAVDVASINLVEHSFWAVNTLTTYNSAQKIEGVPPFYAVASTLWLKCLTVSGSVSKLIFMSEVPDVKKLASFDLPADWKPVDPKTDVGLVWKYVCTRGWENEPPKK